MSRDTRFPLIPSSVGPIPYSELREAAASALAERDWERARALFEAVLPGNETPEALEGLSWAAWWLDDAKTVLEAREQAYRLYRQCGDRRSAARMAIWLAMDYMDFKGEAFIASGWRQRARRLLEGLDPAPEHGWLAIVSGASSGTALSPSTVRQYAEQAIEIGRQVKTPDLEALGLAIKGLALVSEGDIEAGMRCLDEAAVVAASDSLEQQFSPGWVSCQLISACEMVRDFERAEQWCRHMEEEFKRLRFRLWFGVCRAHYAGVLIWRGQWQEAEAELLPATAHLEAARPPSAGEGFVRLGELRRRQGRLDEAEELFEKADGHPLALLGFAELALDQDRPKDARGYVERLLRHLPQEVRSQQVDALEPLIRAHVALGDHARANQTSRALRSIAETVDSAPLWAAASFAQGLVQHMAGEYDQARQHLEDAVDLYRRSSAPFETARARAELARALAMMHEPEAAEREGRAALQGFQALGALLEARKTEALLQLLHAPERPPEGNHRPPGLGAHNGLSNREMEVLRLVAQGLSNKHVAASLLLSEHTVHRHLANIMAKLDVPTRAAAVAYAARHGLL